MYKSLLTCFKFVKSYYKYQGGGDLESQDFLLIPADDPIGSCTAAELQPNNFRKVPADSDWWEWVSILKQIQKSHQNLIPT